jgi:hypothetical protein
MLMWYIFPTKTTCPRFQTTAITQDKITEEVETNNEIPAKGVVRCNKENQGKETKSAYP